jgi:hypothetical protein
MGFDMAGPSNTGRMKAKGIIFRLLLVMLIFTAIIATSIILIGPAEKTSELSAYGDSWDDISNFRSGILGESGNITVSNIISSPTLLETILETDDIPVQNTLFIAIGIEKDYTVGEALSIYNFFLRGGKIIIADDFGYVNSVSNKAFSPSHPGFGIEFKKARLWDNRFEKNPLFVKVPINDMNFHGTILLNEPSAMDPPPSTRPDDPRIKALSSPAGASWVDLNGNGKRDPKEFKTDPKFRGFPLIYELTQSITNKEYQGKALFISDPSLFLNDMWDRENNSEFCTHLVTYLLGDEAVSSGKTKVIFDESRHVPASAKSTFRQTVYTYLVLLVTDTNLRILTPVILVMILLIWIIVVDNPPRLRHRFDIKHIALYNLRTPNIHSRDADRIRALFLEKIRLASGMNLDEFREMSAPELEQMVGDNDLTEFLLDWDKSYTIGQLESLLVVIRDWKPNTYFGGDMYLD